MIDASSLQSDPDFWQNDTLSPTIKKKKHLADLDKYEKTIDPEEGQKKRSCKREDSDILIPSNQQKNQKLFAIYEEEELEVEKDKNKVQSSNPRHKMSIVDDEEQVSTAENKQTIDKYTRSRGNSALKRDNMQRTLKESTTRIFEKATSIINDSRDRTLDSELESDYIPIEEAEQNEVLFRQETRYKQKRCIIFPDDRFRRIWDFIITFNLLYTGIATPFFIAFLDNDQFDLVDMFDYVSNIFFLLDIIVNFMSAYINKQDVLVVRHRTIAWNYITGWFIIDLISILPTEAIFGDSKNYGGLMKVTKLPRLYKLLRLARLVKMLRVIKMRNKFLRYLNELLKLEAGIERLALTILSFLGICHIAACFWYLIGDINNEDPTNWIFRFEYLNGSIFELYMNSFYYIAQTFVTVGYGDINPGNTIERIFAIFLMFAGAFIYSLNVSSLTTILSNLDTKYAKFEEKMNTLLRIKQNYQIDKPFYTRIKRSLKYGHNKNDTDKVQFLNELPQYLRTDVFMKFSLILFQCIQLAIVMYANIFKGIDFFKKHKRRNFLANIGPVLKLVKIGKAEYIFTEGEYANESNRKKSEILNKQNIYAYIVYFIKSGTVSMVIKEYNDFPFISITEGYYFGEVDLLFSETRKFSIRAETDCELLTLRKKDFFKIFFQEFRDIGSDIYNHALKRKLRALKAYREAMAFCKAGGREEIKNNKRGKYTKRHTLASLANPKIALQYRLKLMKEKSRFKGKGNPDEPDTQIDEEEQEQEELETNENQLEPEFILRSRKTHDDSKVSRESINAEHETSDKEEPKTEENSYGKTETLTKKLKEIAQKRALEKEKLSKNTTDSRRPTKRESGFRKVSTVIKAKDELHTKIDGIEKNIEEIVNILDNIGLNPDIIRNSIRTNTDNIKHQLQQKQ